MFDKLNKEGFQIVEGFYTPQEVEAILVLIEKKNLDKEFGLRGFLRSNKDIAKLVLNDKLKDLIELINKGAQIIKSIYFDKPPNVNWHQDLTINVNGKIKNEGYGYWRLHKRRTIVRPPVEFLENIFTIRIHLDKCTKENGALRVIKSSHKNGVYEVKKGVESLKEKEVICEVGLGGILIMKPLILHASRRTENEKNRRVIHIEITNSQLPVGLEWNENVVLRN